MDITEAHVERLLGKRVRDADGEVVGRLQEFHVDIVGGDYLVTEFHIGPAALLERIAGFFTQLPLLKLIPIPKWEYRVPWSALDLSEPWQPRLRVRKADLRRTPPEPSSDSRASGGGQSR